MKRSVFALMLVISLLLCGCSGNGSPAETQATTATAVSGTDGGTSASSQSDSTTAAPITHTVLLYDLRGGTEQTSEFTYTDELAPNDLLQELGKFLSADLTANWIELAEGSSRIDLAHSGAIGHVSSSDEVKGLLDSIRATFCGCYGQGLLLYFTVDGEDTVLFGTELSSSLPYTGGGDYTEQQGTITKDDACGYIRNLASGQLSKDPSELEVSYEGQQVVRSFICYIVAVSVDGEVAVRFAVSLDGSNVFIQTEDGSYGYY